MIALAPSVPDHSPPADGSTLRHFTVAVFVVHAGRVLLHYHRKLQRWLPPGGHIEENELPDHAARREVIEEAGLDVELLGARGVPVANPLQLVVPAGVQVETIYPGHEHVDLVYFAVPMGRPADAPPIPPGLAVQDRVAWYAPDDLVALGVDDEIRLWCGRAVAEVRHLIADQLV